MPNRTLWKGSYSRQAALPNTKFILWCSKKCTDALHPAYIFLTLRGAGFALVLLLQGCWQAGFAALHRCECLENIVLK
ncbi:hypothetical protein [Novosphingobium terrae]|uniref:hypothetical protein n=1 Tax=Novosphingobium terrae TaxID=2726189 RepID=UPI001981260E|nr:hypothetical protein [Novosphingobium terrae]